MQGESKSLTVSRRRSFSEGRLAVACENALHVFPPTLKLRWATSIWAKKGRPERISLSGPG